MTSPAPSSPLILASASPVRRDMLSGEGLDFAVVPSPFDEEAHKEELASLPPDDKAARLAAGKASAVSARYPAHYVIGADQICALGNTIFDKPCSAAQAERHLKALQGRTHQQYSAACLYVGGECVWSDVETVHLSMRELGEERIRDYVAADQPLGACGGYCYEKTGHRLFSEIDGTEAAIKGLPLAALLPVLRAQVPQAFRHG